MASRRFAASFESKVAQFWTSERLHALSKKGYPLSPDVPGAPQLLRVMGLMGSDARIGPDAQRKFHQVNQLFLTVERALSAALSRSKERPLRVLDLCSGQGWMTLLLAFASRHRWNRPVQILAVDSCPKRVASMHHRVSLLGYGEAVRLRNCAIRELRPWAEEYPQAFSAAACPSSAERGMDLPAGDRGERARPPHVALALHACDVATDEAIAFATRAKTSLLAVAPCCQAELGKKWNKLPPGHPFSLVHRTPSLRQEVAAHVTDAMRIALVSASGYSVEASEFVPAEHSPKNRLIVGQRLSAKHAASVRPKALEELSSLKRATGGEGISLERMLGLDRDGLLL